jgi:hypothetical protein
VKRRIYMRSFIPVLARTLHTIALSLWLGGLVAIGALVAPTAFHVTRTAPAFTGNLTLQNAVAGGVVGGSLHLFTFVCYVCGLLLMGTNALLLRSANRRWAMVGMITASLLLMTALYLGFSLTPAMDAAQASGQLPAFDRMHHQYEQISSTVQLPLLLLMALFSSLRDTFRGRD